MNGRTLDVMVVDDSSITIKKLTKMLEDLGHRVTCSAKTGEAAVAAYKEQKPALVTMDITMPDMDGIEATRRILAEDADALIIMVTSHGQEQMVMDAIDAGAKGYVLKPVKPEKLQESIDKIMDKYLS
ncbi:MAG: response regulator [Desulfovibrionaceae bacterium]